MTRMTRKPLFRSVGDALCCAIVVLVLVPVAAWLVLDPYGFTMTLGWLVEALGTSAMRFAPWYIGGCIGFIAGFGACALFSLREV